MGLKKKVIYRPNRHFKELLPILLEKGHRTQALPISVFTFQKFISDNDGLHSEGTHFEMTQTFPLKLEEMYCLMCDVCQRLGRYLNYSNEGLQTFSVMLYEVTS